MIEAVRSTRIMGLADSYSGFAGFRREARTTPDRGIMKDLKTEGPAQMRSLSVVLDLQHKGVLNLPGPAGAAMPVFLKSAVLVGYKSQELGLPGGGRLDFHLGAFMFREVRSGIFGAKAFLEGGGEPSRILSKLGLMDIFDREKAEYLLYAQILLTYEGILRCRARSELAVEEQGADKATVFEFNFGEEIDLDLSGLAANA